MAKKTSERRLAENEVYFCSYNAKLQKTIDEVNSIAAEEGEGPLDFDRDAKLYFLCECSNETCVDKVMMTLDEYNKWHERDDTFTLKPGHQINAIETIVEDNDAYLVVKKKLQPPDSAHRLNPTRTDR